MKDKIKKLKNVLNRKETVVKNAFGATKKIEPSIEKVLDELLSALIEEEERHEREIKKLHTEVDKLKKDCSNLKKELEQTKNILNRKK